MASPSVAPQFQGIPPLPKSVISASALAALQQAYIRSLRTTAPVLIVASQLTPSVPSNTAQPCSPSAYRRVLPWNQKSGEQHIIYTVIDSPKQAPLNFFIWHFFIGWYQNVTDEPSGNVLLVVLFHLLPSMTYKSSCPKERFCVLQVAWQHILNGSISSQMP